MQSAAVPAILATAAHDASAKEFPHDFQFAPRSMPLCGRAPGASSPAACTAISTWRACRPGYPQFFARAEGATLWDVDGNAYVDFMCAYGPMVLGYGNREVEAAAGGAARAGRRADRPVRAAGRAGREAGRHGGARRLGDVPEERHRCDDAVRRDRARGHREAQDPGGARRLSRLGAVVHAASRRHDRRGPRPSRALRLQRRRQPAGRGRVGRRRPRGRHRLGLQARLRQGPGAADPGLRPGRAQALRRDRRGADPRRRARGLPPRPRRQLADGRREARPRGLLQGDRQRLYAGRRHRQRQVPRRRRRRSS